MLLAYSLHICADAAIYKSSNKLTDLQKENGERAQDPAALKSNMTARMARQAQLEGAHWTLAGSLEYAVGLPQSHQAENLEQNLVSLRNNVSRILDHVL